MQQFQDQLDFEILTPSDHELEQWYSVNDTPLLPKRRTIPKAVKKKKRQAQKQARKTARV